MAERIEFVFKGDASDLRAALGGIQQDTAAIASSTQGVAKDSSLAFVTLAAKVNLAGTAIKGATRVVKSMAAPIQIAAKRMLDLSTRLNQFAKDAKQFGTTAEEIQKLDGALGLLTDGSVKATNVLKFMGKNLADAADGAGPAKDALDKLGLSASDLVDLPVSEQLARIADEMPKLTTQSERTQVAMDLLGRAGSRMLPAFTEGGDALRAATAEIEKAGIISNEAALAAEYLEDSMLLLGQQVDALKDGSLAPLLPLLAQVTEAFRIFLGQETDGAGERVSAFAQAVDEQLIPALATVSIMAKQSADAFAVLLPFLEAGSRVLVGGLTLADLDDIWEGLKKGTKGLGNFKDATRENVIEVEQMILRLREMRGEMAGGTSAAGGSSGGGIAGVVAGDKTAALDAFAEGDFDADGQMTMQEAASKVGTSIEGVSAGASQAAADAAAKAREEFEKAIAEAKEAAAAKAEAIRSTTAAVADSMRTLAQLQSSMIVDITRAATDAEIAQTKRGTKARKEAVLKGFRMNQAAALASAGINTALAVTSAAATAPFVPLGIIAMAAAAAAGAVQIGIIASKKPPQFHRGGVLGQAASDEIDVRARAGEGFLNNSGVAAAGGAAGVARLNRGGSSGPDAVYVVNRVGPQMVDVQTSRALRRNDSPLNEGLRRVRPRSIGAHDPFAKV